MQHPDITRIELTGYPWVEEEEVLFDEDEEAVEEEIWGEDCGDSLFEERRERELFGKWMGAEA